MTSPPYRKPYEFFREVSLDLFRNNHGVRWNGRPTALEHIIKSSGEARIL